MSSSTVSVTALQHGHFCPITSTCFVLHVFFCAVSWGLSVAVGVVLLVLSGGARATELSVRCLQHMFYTWWLIVQCFRGVRWSLQVFFWLCPFFFVPYGWLAFLHCGVERVILFYGFQLLLTREVRLLVDDYGGWLS